MVAPTSTPTKMEILQATQKSLDTLGISKNLVIQPYPFNGRAVAGLLVLLTGLTGCLTFTFYGAKTFPEYTQSIYMAAAIALINFSLLIFVLNAKKCLKLIDDTEAIANTSK